MRVVCVYVCMCVCVTGLSLALSLSLPPPSLSLSLSLSLSHLAAYERESCRASYSICERALYEALYRRIQPHTAYGVQSLIQHMTASYSVCRIQMLPAVCRIELYTAYAWEALYGIRLAASVYGICLAGGSIRQTPPNISGT